MEEKRKRRNWILGIVIVLAAAATALLPVLLSSAQQEAEDNASILSATVERGDIRSTISGGGTLAEEDGVKISVPKGVEVTEYLVANGEWVDKDQPIAAVDKVTVMNTIAVVQKNLEYLDRQIMALATPKTTAVLVSPAAGRVKAVYVEKGDAVADVMAEHGALVVISLDGKMAVQLEYEGEINTGDAVTVTLPDGTAVPGRVELRQGTMFVATISDDGPGIGDTVSVTAADGTDLGSGELYVHSAWNLTAASGNVNVVYAKVGQQVISTSRLCSLENMDGNGKYDKLSAQRREYEDAMLKLFSLYRYGAVTAPEEGRVAGIDKAKVGVMRASEPEFVLTLLSNTDGEDAPPVEVVHAAAVSAVTYGSVLFTVQKAEATGDYKTAPTVDYSDVSPLILTTELAADPVPSVPVLGPGEDGNWVTVGPDVLTAGDVLYIVYSVTDDEETPIRILRPTQPKPSTDYDLGGFSFGGGGGAAQPFEMYDLTEKELLRVVPQNTMTVKVVIDELDILSVAEGQEADVTVDALPGRSFTGVVTEIDPKGSNQGGNTKYTVTIAIDRDPNMLAGMNATAILTVGVTEDVLTLPAAALTEKGSKTLAYTGYDEQTRTLLDPLEVETGVSDGTTVEILSGLEEGTQVWYSYYESGLMPDFLAGLPTDNA